MRALTDFLAFLLVLAIIAAVGWGTYVFVIWLVRIGPDWLR